MERARHILVLARQLASNPDRRLCYATTEDAYLGERDTLREPLLLDHHGHWQALGNIHPTAPFARPPVRLPEVVSPAMVIC